MALSLTPGLIKGKISLKLWAEISIAFCKVANSKSSFTLRTFSTNSALKTKLRSGQASFKASNWVAEINSPSTKTFFTSNCFNCLAISLTTSIVCITTFISPGAWWRIWSLKRESDNKTRSPSAVKISSASSPEKLVKKR